MTQTTNPDTDATVQSDEQVFRAAVWANCRAVIREHGDAGLLTMLEGLAPEHQRVILDVMDYYDERDERLAGQ